MGTLESPSGARDGRGLVVYTGSWDRNAPSLAVALNCGIGSSLLNALVKAFDRLHIVWPEKSGYSGSKYNRWTIGKQRSGCFQLAVHKRGIQDQLRLVIADLRLPPLFHLTLHRLEVPLNALDTHGERVDEIEALRVLGQDRREHA